MPRIFPHTEELLWGPGIIWLMRLIIFHEKNVHTENEKRRYIHSKATTEKKKKAQQSLWLLSSHLLFDPETPMYLLCTLRYPELTKGWFSSCLILQKTQHWEALTHTAISVNKACHPCFPSSSQRGNNLSFQQQFSRSYYMYLYLRTKESTSDMKL